MRAGRRGPRRPRDTLPPRLPWRTLQNPMQPVEGLSADQIEAIHRASLRVLAEAGLRVLHAGAREWLKGAGAEVDASEQMVRFPPGMVAEHLTQAPSSFRLRARNPKNNLMVGGAHHVFSGVGGPSFCSDIERGRRPGSYAEMCNFMRVLQSLNILHQEGGGPFEPMDLPSETRYLDIYYAAITLTDKNWKPWALGRHRATDAIEMTCIAHGIDRAALAEMPALVAIINTNSPLHLDIPMCEGLIENARAGQPVVVTPFTLSGAMSPATLAGALTLQNAEALAGLTLAQVVNPGTPVVYGAFTSNVDMKSGAPAFGTPEYAKAAQAGGQLARFYGVPYRSSNTTASNLVDAQAAYESEMSLWGALMGHANLLAHGAGWLEGGLTASFEKLILDAEMLQMMAEYMTPIVVDEDSLGLSAIHEVGPGGHFFGAAHTLERYETAFYAPLVSDWRNFETWSEDGGRSATERANAIWKQLLKDYEPPPIDPGVDEALRDYVARRKAGAESGA